MSAISIDKAKAKPMSHGFLPDGRNRLLQGIREQVRARLAELNAKPASEAEKQQARVAIQREAENLTKLAENGTNLY